MGQEYRDTKEDSEHPSSGQLSLPAGVQIQPQPQGSSPLEAQESNAPQVTTMSCQA